MTPYAKQKAALTRAVKSGDQTKIEEACRKAVREWEAKDGAFRGGWPDDWARWERALNDSRGWLDWTNLDELR